MSLISEPFRSTKKKQRKKVKLSKNPLIKYLVQLRMFYADVRGHHGKKWNYEPGDHYMGRSKNRRKHVNKR